jgi:hypothetical protein
LVVPVVVVYSSLEDPSSTPASLHVDHRLRHLLWLTFAWRMRCRHRRPGCSLRADALPLGSSSVGGCFATIVGRMLGRRVLGRMHCHLGRLLKWMLCHLVVSELV